MEIDEIKVGKLFRISGRVIITKIEKGQATLLFLWRDEAHEITMPVVLLLEIVMVRNAEDKAFCDGLRLVS